MGMAKMVAVMGMAVVYLVAMARQVVWEEKEATQGATAEQVAPEGRRVELLPNIAPIRIAPLCHRISSGCCRSRLQRPLARWSRSTWCRRSAGSRSCTTSAPPHGSQ
eukprot:2860652-Prymnesium_polylepis.1